MQTLLGHASVATTERYTAVDDDEICAAMMAPDAKTLRVFLRIVRLRDTGFRRSLLVHRQGLPDDEDAVDNALHLSRRALRRCGPPTSARPLRRYPTRLGVLFEICG